MWREGFIDLVNALKAMLPEATHIQREIRTAMVSMMEASDAEHYTRFPFDPNEQEPGANMRNEPPQEWSAAGDFAAVWKAVGGENIALALLPAEAFRPGTLSYKLAQLIQAELRTTLYFPTNGARLYRR